MTAPGFVDPLLLPPRSAIERALFDAVLRRGCTLRLVRPDGRAVRLVGPGGLHITAECLAWLKPVDVAPTSSRR